MPIVLEPVVGAFVTSVVDEVVSDDEVELVPVDDSVDPEDDVSVGVRVVLVPRSVLVRVIDVVLSDVVDDDGSGSSSPSLLTKKDLT